MGSLHYGGAFSSLELIKDAKRRGYTIHVVLPKRGNFSAALAKHKIKYSIFRYHTWDPKPLHRYHARSFIETTSKLQALVKELKPDCIVSNTFTVPWGAFCAAITDTPHIWIGREIPINSFSYLDGKFDFIQNYSNQIFVNSNSLRDFLKQSFGFKNISLVRSVVDESSLSLNKNLIEKRLVCIGTIHLYKNQIDVLHAYNALPTGIQNKIKIVFIGDFSSQDPYYQKLVALIAKSKIADKVTFTGLSNAPFKLVGENDIIIQPSLAESIGRITVEAMKLGLVCLGADIPGTLEAFKKGGGTPYKSQDPKDLAKQIQLIINNFDAYKVLARKAQIRALHNLSKQNCHDEFFKKLPEIMLEQNPRKELGIATNWFEPLSEKLVLADKVKGYKQIMRSQKSDLMTLHRRNRTLSDQMNLILKSRGWKLIRSLDEIRTSTKKRHK